MLTVSEPERAARSAADRRQPPALPRPVEPPSTEIARPASAPRRDAPADSLGDRLQRAVAGRSPGGMLQRVHYPALRAVGGHYHAETAQSTMFIGALLPRIRSCALVYARVRGRPVDTPLTLRVAEVPELSRLGGPYDRVTRTTTLTPREWLLLLNRWRELFDEHYFSYTAGVPDFAGRLPHNFALKPAHVRWLRSLAARRGVERDSDEARARSEVSVAAGRLRRAGLPGRPAVDTSQSVTWFNGLGWEIYVLSHDGHLHMASHMVGKRHHSSLLGRSETSATRARDAAGAGEMLVRDGKIEKLSIKTGHYMAGLAQLRQIVQWLAKRGADLAGTQLQSFDGSQVAADAADWWQNQGARTYETEKTDRAIEWYRAQYGMPAIQAAMSSLGWVWTPVAGGRHAWRKPDGGLANARDVRKALKARFPRHWEPVTTQGGAPGAVPTNV